MVRAYLALKQPAAEERQIAELVWWHSMKATEYRRRALQVDAAALGFDQSEREDTSTNMIRFLFTNPETGIPLKWNLYPMLLPGSLPLIELLDNLAREFHRMPWLLSSTDSPEQDCATGERRLQEIPDEETASTGGRATNPSSASGKTSDATTEGDQGNEETSHSGTPATTAITPTTTSSICPPCGVVDYQVEWFHEQVFLSRFVEDATAALEALQRERERTAERTTDHVADRNGTTGAGGNDVSSVEQHPIETDRAEDHEDNHTDPPPPPPSTATKTTLSPFHQKTHAFHHDPHVRSWIPYGLDRTDEAWAVVLTGLPEVDELGRTDDQEERITSSGSGNYDDEKEEKPGQTSSSEKQQQNQDSEQDDEQDETAFHTALRNLHVYVTAIRVLAHSVLKRARIRRPFLVLHNYKGPDDAVDNTSDKNAAASSSSTSESGGKRKNTKASKRTDYIMQYFLNLLRSDGLEPVYVEPPAVEDLPRSLRQRGDDEHADKEQKWRRLLGDSWWAKTRLWQMTEYKRIVYLDADMLVLQNLENLFTMENVDFALPVYEDSVIGLMVIRPNLSLYNTMIDTLQHVAPFIDANLRSLDQSFQHFFWYYAGLQAAGYAVFSPDTGAFLHCDQEQVEDHESIAEVKNVDVPTPRTQNKPYLQPPKVVESLSERKNLRDYNSSTSVQLQFASKAERGHQDETSHSATVEVQPPVEQDETEAGRSKTASKPHQALASDEQILREQTALLEQTQYKVCVLSLEYHLAVTYPAVHKLVRYPDRFADSAELVYKVLAQVEQHAKLLHWPGERRKPWMHWSQVARTPYDALWWIEYQNVEHMDRRTANPAVRFRCGSD
ncbi:unnamed protein product [Amoebophrya sp. A120]|nr:unnamed protein product [Amoebophrya sp. A120]|eukprot:GSA120T00005768001.1